METTNTEATVKPKRYVSKNQDPGKMIYIGNLLFNKPHDEIKALFAEYGKVKSVKIIVEPETNISKGYAFVKMSSSKNAIVAIEALNGKELDGRMLKVSEAKPQDQKNLLSSDKKQKLTSREKMEKKELTKELREKKAPRKKRGLETLFEYLGK